ncbi:MAG TPA: DUF1206 domain-containing protein [Polyangia bacterium]|nr:DUF1206 domain-containing protein [Polyangia bacterium]
MGWPRADRQPAGRLQIAVRRAVERAQPWADWVARAGYVTKGMVFLLVGDLAVAAAAGLGGKATGPSGALRTVARLPAGRALLVLVALGLLAHVAFRAVLVLVGEPYLQRGRLGRVALRIGNGFAALVYLGLAISTGALAAGWHARRRAGSDDESRNLSARLLSAPFGRPLLGAVALGILIVAALQLVRAVAPHDMAERLHSEQMTKTERAIVKAMGRVAFAARAVVLASCGYFVGRAAIDRAPREARGPAGALHAVWELPHGALWLAVVGGGLIVFGVYGLLEARWRRLFGRGALRG